MKKRVTKLAVIAMVVGGGIFANTQKVQANILSHREVGPCIDGYADVFEMGWFGSIRSHSYLAQCC